MEALHRIMNAANRFLKDSEEDHVCDDDKVVIIYVRDKTLNTKCCESVVELSADAVELLDSDNLVGVVATADVVREVRRKAEKTTDKNEGNGEPFLQGVEEIARDEVYCEGARISFVNDKTHQFMQKKSV